MQTFLKSPNFIRSKWHIMIKINIIMRIMRDTIMKMEITIIKAMHMKIKDIIKDMIKTKLKTIKIKVRENIRRSQVTKNE